MRPRLQRLLGVAFVAAALLGPLSFAHPALKPLRPLLLASFLLPIALIVRGARRIMKGPNRPR